MAFQTTFHTISYKQYYTNINNIIQAKNIIQTQGYLIGHLKSNTNLSPPHPQRSRHYERLGIRHWHFPFSGSYGVATYFISKIIKLYKLQHILNNTHFH